MRRRSLSLHLSLAAAVSAVGLFGASPALAGSDHVRAGGPRVRYAALPADATARVHAVYDSSGDSRITLQVRILRPNTRYGAHAHVDTCGLQPGDAGGHFQERGQPRPRSRVGSSPPRGAPARSSFMQSPRSSAHPTRGRRARGSPVSPWRSDGADRGAARG